ncbi:MAG: FecR domain-containing protein [Solitalea sp.]
MNSNEADRLLEKYLSGRCAPEEAAYVEQRLDAYTARGNGWENASRSDRLNQIAEGRERLAASLTAGQQMLTVRKRKRLVLQRAAALAAFVALAATGYFQMVNRADVHLAPEFSASDHQTDFSPGTDKAVLTLPDGSVVVLDSTTSGKLAGQGNASIHITATGQAIYATPPEAGANPLAYHTISTPRGGQFQVILPDNSKVWLNAVSSIRFPTVFSGKVRTVEITGEAYFEVAQKPDQPFVVKAGAQRVEVLGTHFNINSYTDEKRVKTTLLEGSVKITSETDSLILEPGQQAVLEAAHAALTVNNVETDQVVAWKNGFFQIDHADIQTIMRQVERWYDVEVEYEGNLPDKLFSGKIRRDVNASQLLDMLAYFGVQFRIEENKITVIN